MTSRSSVEVSKQRREKQAVDADRRQAVNELLTIYLQLSDAPNSERAALRQAIYDTHGIAVTARDETKDQVIVTP